MSELDLWADQQGHRKVHSTNSHQWLTEHPQLVEQIGEGRDTGWGWDTIVAWLAVQHNCPFSVSSMRAAAHRVGIQ